MTDKEFKQLSRAELIEIIYQLQLQVDGLTQQKQTLEKELADKRLRITNAGNIAEAALELNDCFRSAQSAADHYLAEIKAIREETEEECKKLLAAARAEAEAIVNDPQKKQGDMESAIDIILKEYGKNPSDNG